MSNSELQAFIDDYIDQRQPRFSTLSDAIWDHPETRFNETYSATLLADALDTLRGEPSERWTPELAIGAQGRLPEDWIADDDIRLGTYMRLARLDEHDEVDLVAAELEDRFGDMPDAARALIAATRLRADARRAGIAKLGDLTPRGIRTHLGLNKPIYERSAAYGHFGRQAEGDFFPWEKLDLVDDLKAALA